jgi:putative Holliday junction resolvase
MAFELFQRLDKAEPRAGELAELMIEISASRQLSGRDNERHSSSATPACLPAGCKASCPVLPCQRKSTPHDLCLSVGGHRAFLGGLCAHLRQTTCMRILAIDHGSKRMGIAVSDELKMIAQPLEFVPAHPLDGFLARLNELIRDKEVELILVGMPRNMDGSYGPAAQKVQEFVAALKGAVSVPIKTWDERLTSAQANRLLIQGNVRRDKRKAKVDAMAAAILLQSYLDGLGA